MDSNQVRSLEYMPIISLYFVKRNVPSSADPNHNISPKDTNIYIFSRVILRPFYWFIFSILNTDSLARSLLFYALRISGKHSVFFLKEAKVNRLYKSELKESDILQG